MARLFEMYELEAFLGEFVSDFDVDAIIDDATYIEDGNRFWIEGIDLDAICERHALDSI